jgi:hypothetical protein
MATSSPTAFNSFSESVVLRWMFKAFLLGLFLGAAAAINALAVR